jgi:hypothetical protein
MLSRSKNCLAYECPKRRLQKIIAFYEEFLYFETH